MQLRFGAVFLTLPLMFVACGSPTIEPECIPGARPVCGCDDGRTGYQECEDDGTYGDCICTAAPRDDAGTHEDDDAGRPVDSGAPVDAGPLVADAGVDASPPPTDGTLLRTAPGVDVVHVRDTVMLQYVASPPAERVELVLDGVVLAHLSPPYTFAWDTRPYAEGDHVIRARAIRGGVESFAEDVTVVVDRTSPWVISRFPAPGEPQTWLGDPFVIEFSEPLLPSSVRDTAIVITNGTAVPLRKAIALDATSTKASVTLTELPALPASVRLDVTTEATDLAGNPVVADVWGFTVPGWSRLPALSGIGAFGELAITVEEATAHPYVGWRKTAGVEVAYHDGTAWRRLGEPVPGGMPVNAFRMQANASGKPVVGVRTAAGLTVARWTGTAWEQLGPTLPLAGYDVSRWHLAVDAAGTPILGLRTADLRSLEVSRWVASAWSALPPITLPTSGNFGLATRSPGTVAVARGESDSSVATTLPDVIEWSGGAWAPVASLPLMGSSGPATTASLSVVTVAATTSGRLAVVADGYALHSDGPASFSGSWQLGASGLTDWAGVPRFNALVLAEDGRGMGVTSLGIGSVSIACERPGIWRSASVTVSSAFASAYGAVDSCRGSIPVVVGGTTSDGSIGVYRSNEFAL